jgi:hypothetical protein
MVGEVAFPKKRLSVIREQAIDERRTRLSIVEEQGYQ